MRKHGKMILLCCVCRDPLPSVVCSKRAPENRSSLLYSLPSSATIRPVRLPNMRQLQSPFLNQLATASGWGALFQNAPEVLPLNDLRRVSLPVISNLNCAVRFPGWITENQICVATDMGSPCHGDQGGPLTVADPDGRTTLIGLFAYNSILGCNSGWPAVFTRVTPYLLWIAENSDVIISLDFEY